MSKDNKNTKSKKKSGTSKKGLASASKETKMFMMTTQLADAGGKASKSSGKTKK